MKRISIFIATFIVSALVVGFVSHKVKAATYVFPVLGQSSFSNDYNAPRGNGPHNAIDIIAKKGQTIVSATDGKITSVNYPQPSWGNAVVVLGNDNMCYWYIHINNDNPGTDDGEGGPMRAYGPDMAPGNPIKKGQLIGWVGDSGNAESTVSHLHFEVLRADMSRQNPCSFTTGSHINPYNNLKAATRISKPSEYPQLPNEILPYGSRPQGINVAIGDVSGDGRKELIVGTGVEGDPRVRVYDSSTRKQIATYYAFELSRTSKTGVDVATGDVDGDGKDELITGAHTTDGARIAIHKVNGSTVSKVREFGTFPGFKYSVTVAAGDVNGDGKAEIITAAGVKGEPRVNVFSATGTVLSTKYVFDQSFRGGVDVAVGDVTGTGIDEIMVAPMSIGSSEVKVLNGQLNSLKSFYAYGSGYRGGVRLSVGNVNLNRAKEEILTVPGFGNPDIRQFDGNGVKLNSQQFFIERWWRGYYDVAAGDGQTSSLAGVGTNRRASIRFY